MSHVPGCTTASRDHPDAAGQIATATGVRGPIAFHTTGQSDDAAGPTLDDQVLHPHEAIESAVDHDPRIQSALARVRAAAADAGQARLLPNPLLAVAVRYPRSGGSPTVDAGVSMELVALLTRSRRISAADHRLRAAAADAVTAALDVVAEVRQSYWSSAAADQMLDVLEQQQRVVARLIELADARVRAGESPRLDLTALEAQRAELEAERIDRSAARTDERLALARLLGQPSAAADWKLLAWDDAPAPAARGETDWIATALQSRPEIQARTWELAALDDDAAVSGVAILDGAEVGADAERDEGSWSIGPALTLPLPLLDWGQSRRASMQARRIEARHELTQARRQIIEETRRAYSALEAARAAARTVEDELIPAQQRRREQAEAAYRTGATDVTAVLLAEQDLHAARAKLIELRKNIALAGARLERAAGGSGTAQIRDDEGSSNP